MVKYNLSNFSVMSVQYSQYSFEYYLSSMNKLGIKNIDFWGGEPHYFSDGQRASKLRLEKIKSLIDQYEMNVVVYTPETLSYPFSYSHPDNLVRKRTVQYLKNAIDDAVYLNCPYVFMNSGCGLRDLTVNDSLSLLIDSYRQIVTYAQENGITMVLEQLQPYESNLITDIDSLEYVINSINSNCLKICVDVVAMEVACETLETYFNRFGRDRIALIHFSDSHHYILGEGDTLFPLKDYLKTLARFNYDGIIDLEINDSIYWLDPHTSIRKSINWLKNNIKLEMK